MSMRCMVARDNEKQRGGEQERERKKRKKRKKRLANWLLLLLDSNDSTVGCPDTAIETSISPVGVLTQRKPFRGVILYASCIVARKEKNKKKKNVPVKPKRRYFVISRAR